MAGESAHSKAIRAREKAERLVRYADQWEKGALGESQTARALEQLGPEWTVWHDLKWPGRRFANIDHLVIGPGGIFVIDSKNWSGLITVKDGILRQNGRRREQAVAGCADSALAVAGCADSALAVGELLPRYLNHVRPVLCFVRDEAVPGWAREVMLCSTANVVTMLQTRQPVLGIDKVADAVITLKARMNTAARTAPGPPERVAVARNRIQTTPATRRGSRRAGPLVRLAFIILVIAVFVAFAKLVPDLVLHITRR